MIISPTYLNALSSAATPEEAAKVFYAAVSKALAAVVADALSKTVKAAGTTAAGKPEIKGRDKLIGGLAMQLTWESPAILNPIPLTQIACFAPYEPELQANAGALGVNVSIGVSVSASF